MKKPIIAGIQQMGIGIPNVNKAWDWYRKAFGMDIPVFDEAATAGLMLPYTGGEPRERHAILALNANGGGGFEIWQYTSRTPVAADFTVMPGDLGIFATKIKSKNVEKTYQELKKQGLNLTPLGKTPEGKPTFFVNDEYSNDFQIVPSDDWFRDDKYFSTGGVYGAIIGVSNIEKSLSFYSEILGFDTVVYDKTGIFEDFKHLEGGKNTFRRVLLRHSKPRGGAFSKMLGAGEIELIQVQDKTPRKIFENRLWGDLGFIHLCFDINGMAEMKDLCESKGHSFTVDSSSSFDMGEAAGHFTYIEDPDGTLIEFVETHKVPILKKIGWYLDLRKRNPEKQLPNWMLRALALNRKKD